MTSVVRTFLFLGAVKMSVKKHGFLRRVTRKTEGDNGCSDCPLRDDPISSNSRKEHRKKINKRWISIIAVLLAAAILLLVLFVYSRKNPFDVVLTDFFLREEKYSGTYTVKITGQITNISCVTVNDVQIKIFLYDGDGTVVGMATDHLAYLKAGQTWRFSAVEASAITPPVSYQIVEIDYDWL